VHRQGAEENAGIATARAIFRDARNGDFNLAQDSEAWGLGEMPDLAMSMGDPARISPGERDRLNRGAFQTYGLTSVPKLEARQNQILERFRSTAAVV
jgi:hypothetical protein